MHTNASPEEMLSAAEEHYIARALCKEGKAQSFEMGLEDSYAADAADVSSRPSNSSSDCGSAPSDVAGSPLLQNATTTDDEADHDTAPSVTTSPLLTSHHPRPVKLSCSAPADCPRRGLLTEKTVVQLEKGSARREVEEGLRTPQQSPSLHPTTIPAATISAGVALSPPSAPVLVPRTPPQELKRYPSSAKVAVASAIATSSSLQAHTSPVRCDVAPMLALEAPPSPLPAPLVGSDCVALQPRSPERISPKTSPRAPVVLDEEPDVCCICLEEYSDDNPMFRGECQHHFHLACLMEWKQRSNSCPMCCAETLHGVGDMSTPQNRKPLDPAELARQRELAAQDEAFAHRLQRKYLLRAQQRQHQRLSPRQQPHAVLTISASPLLTPSRSPQMRPQRNITPLPPLSSAPRSATPNAARNPPRAHTSNGAAAVTPVGIAVTGGGATGSSVTPTRPTLAHPLAPVTARTASSNTSKPCKANHNTPTQASPSESQPRSTSPVVHTQFQSGRSGHRSRRRTVQNGCAFM